MLAQNADKEIKHLQNQIKNKSEEIHHLQDDFESKNEELQIYQDEKEYPETYPWTDNDKKLREEKDTEINQIKSKLHQLTTIIYTNQVTRSTLE